MARQFEQTQNVPGPLLATYIGNNTAVVDAGPEAGEKVPLANKHATLEYLNNGGSMSAFADAAELVIAQLWEDARYQQGHLDIYTPWGYELISDVFISPNRDPDPRSPSAQGIEWGPRVYLRVAGGTTWLFGNWTGRWFRLPDRPVEGWTNEQAIGFGETSFLASGAADYSMFAPAEIAQGTLPGGFQWIPSADPTLNPNGFIIDTGASGFVPYVPDFPGVINGNGGPQVEPSPFPAPPDLLPTPPARAGLGAGALLVGAVGLYLLSQ